MAINFPSNPNDGDTILVGNTTYTFNSTSGVWDAGSSGSAIPTTLVSTVADMAALIAKTGMSNGDQALVLSSNNLFMYSGTGWYKIATIQNDSPTAITGVSGSYSLAIDGTPTVITAVSTDPEGFPLTWTYSTSGLGSIATISQEDNVFTITPSTNDTNSGTFTLTINATDGVNGAVSTNTSIELEFIITNSNYTTLLATAVDTSDNNNITDSSSNNHTITVTGDAHAGTFSPYRHGGYSTYFPGLTTSNSLAVNSNDVINFGTGDFTIEAWIFLETSNSSIKIIEGRPSNTNGYYATLTTSPTYLSFYVNSNALLNSSSVPGVGVWSHCAVVRNNGTTTIYHNGQSGGSASDTNNYISTSVFGFGGYNAFTGEPTRGEAYIKDLRIVKGTAVYTSNFTPPTERLTAITNTALLTCHLPYIVDGSSNGHSITVNGNTSTKPFGPYGNLKYAAADHGGSVYFDGSGDKLTITGTYANFGTNPFTVEAWVYPTTANGPIFTTHRVNEASGFYFSLSTTNNTMIHGRYHGSNASTSSSANAVKLNQWNHFAWCREGTGSNQTRMFANGKVVATYTDDQDYSSAPYGPYVGGYDAGGPQYDVNGNIADLRVVSGTALYTADFTPPTAPLSSSGTELHIKGTDASIIDKSQVSNLKLVGNTTGSTTQVKFVDTKSMYFDGTGDYITMAPSNLFTFGTEDFTIEGWAYPTATGDKGIFQQGTSNFPTSSANSLAVQTTTSGTKWAIYAGNTQHIAATATYSLNQWYHFAIVRASSTTKLYIDGVEVISISDTTNYTGTYMGIGSIYGAANAQCFVGYIEDFRVTNGLARYTANFTPPTAPLKG